MKNIIKSVTRTIATLAVAMFLLNGCSAISRLKPKAQPKSTIESELDAMVGVMSHDEAVERLGTPSEVDDREDVITLLWRDVVEPVADDPDVYYIKKPDYKVEELTLKFDKRTIKLTGWSHRKY